MSAADVRGWARDVERFANEAPGEVIDVVERAILERLRADTGGDGAFSHGRKLGKASTNVRVRDGEAIVEPAGSRGVWGILQGGTSRGVKARHTFTEGADRGLDEAERKLLDMWGEL